MEKYENMGTVGEGSYGVVMKCRRKDNGELVAIKKFLDNEEEDKAVKKIAMREIRMLKKLKHDNLVNLIEVFRRKKRLYLVFEYIDFTVLDNLERCPNGLDEKTTKKILFQVIRGLEFCHKCNTIHRDVKPENILVSKTGVVKICDFGFARSATGENLTDYVATRWYRSPELLVGDPHYGKPVDVWAVGCLASEMLTGEPLFPGDSDIDQLYHIVRCQGNLPTRYRDIFHQNPLFVGMRVPETRNREPLEKKVHKGSKLALDLIQCCLFLDAEERQTCRQLLEHEFFRHRNFAEKFTEELRLKLRKQDATSSPPHQEEAEATASVAAPPQSPGGGEIFTKPQPVLRHGGGGGETNAGKDKDSEKLLIVGANQLHHQEPPKAAAAAARAPQPEKKKVHQQFKKPSQIPVAIAPNKIHPIGGVDKDRDNKDQHGPRRHQNQQRSSDELMDKAAAADDEGCDLPRRDLDSREISSQMPPIGQAGRLTALSNLDDSLGTVGQFAHLTAVSPAFSPATGFQDFWTASPFGRFNETTKLKKPQVHKKSFSTTHQPTAQPSDSKAAGTGHYHGFAPSKPKPLGEPRGLSREHLPLPEVRGAGTDSKIGVYHPRAKKDPWPPSFKWK